MTDFEYLVPFFFIQMGMCLCVGLWIELAVWVWREGSQEIE